MKKKYNPIIVEKHIQKHLNEINLIKCLDKKKSSEKFCIMVPPPNITGSLHMGHAFQQTIIDTIIRYQYMSGKDVLLQFGTDHAGIATQIIVERELFKKFKKNKDDYTKNDFLKKIWEWKNNSENIIISQMKRMGYLIDWEKKRFTLDNDFSKSVRKVFVQLYEDGLIYQRKKISYWDTVLKTVVSDLEVQNKNISGKIWNIKYPLILKKKNTKYNKKDYIVISTTRPETLLGDTAIAVHPEDNRYSDLIGNFVLVPLIDRIIPIISDCSVDINKGTGCIKVTPAHDFLDYEIGQRNKLPMINIFTIDGKILEKFDVFDFYGKKSNCYDVNVPKNFRLLDRFLVREKIVIFLKKNNFLKNIEICYHVVPHGDRSGSILEPKLTNQWYLKVKSLSKLAIQVVKNKEIVFFPENYTNMYLSWMNRITDWCISRQLLWGHQIPVWYDFKRNVYVGENEKLVRKKYNISDNLFLYQENDVLDTWFSSSLWTFAGLGWPNKTKKLKDFHPTSILVSGFDIIFFWISRMIMMTTYFIKNKDGSPQVPFKKVYITGLIRDENGKKMSKSEGNVLDPIDMVNGINLNDLIKKRTSSMLQPKFFNKIIFLTKNLFPNGIETYGADALRFTFISLTSTSRKINWDMNRLKGYKYFCNKLWNSGIFFLSISKNTINKKDVFFKDKSIFDQWILLELNYLIKKYHESFSKFRFDIITSILYDFTWHKFCDYYLEVIKLIFKKKILSQQFNLNITLFNVFSSLLSLIHPIMPFITEYIWKKIIFINPSFKKNIILNKIPKFNKNLKKNSSFYFVKWFRKIQYIVREIRFKFKLKFNEPINIFLKNINIFQRIFIRENYKILKELIYATFILEVSKNKEIKNSFVRLLDKTELWISGNFFIKYKINEIFRIDKEILLLNNKIEKLQEQISNKYFILNAPKLIILQKKNQLKQCILNKNKLYIQKKVIN